MHNPKIQDRKINTSQPLTPFFCKRAMGQWIVIRKKEEPSAKKDDSITRRHDILLCGVINIILEDMQKYILIYQWGRSFYIE